MANWYKPLCAEAAAREPREMITVNLSIAPELKHLIPSGLKPGPISLPESGTCRHLQRMLGLDEAPVVWFVNQRLSALEDTLEDGAEVEVLPVVDGG